MIHVDDSDLVDFRVSDEMAIADLRQFGQVKPGISAITDAASASESQSQTAWPSGHRSGNRRPKAPLFTNACTVPTKPVHTTGEIT